MGLRQMGQCGETSHCPSMPSSLGDWTGPKRASQGGWGCLKSLLQVTEDLEGSLEPSEGGSSCTSSILRWILLKQHGRRGRSMSKAKGGRSLRKGNQNKQTRQTTPGQPDFLASLPIPNPSHWTFRKGQQGPWRATGAAHNSSSQSFKG